MGVLLFAAAVFALAEPCPLAGQASDTASSRPGLRLGWRLGERDFLLPITAIQWGSPERWSFTGRFVHRLDVAEHGVHATWTVGLSPGTGGARAHTGILGVFNLPEHPDTAVRWGASLELLRTWGRPLGAVAYRNYGGVELSGGLPPFLLVGLGRYWPIGAGDAGPVWGFRIGFGI
ncbi:MAG TPA: hypothetical protein VJ957_00655 [Longimicrobiales bacterium]|nr:hypothetical protein [Longimicrobiales bacterium]